MREIAGTKNQKSMQGVHFITLPASPHPAEFYEIWHTRSTHCVLLVIRWRHMSHVSHHMITCVKFLVNRFMGYGVLTPQNCHFPLTCCVAVTTVYTVTLPRDTVMTEHRKPYNSIHW